MNRTLRIVLSILAVLIIAGGSFFGGTLYGKKQAQATFATAPQRGAFEEGAFPGGTAQRNGQGGALRGAQSGGMLLGQIQEIGDGVMVVTDPNGKQTQVKVTDTTLIEKQASVSLTDLTVGDTVMVSGSKADDGSITARSVQAGVSGRFSPPDGSAPMGTGAP